MDWTAAADEARLQILMKHAEDLYVEAERIARRNHSETVGVNYLTEAAHRTGVGQAKSPRADVGMALGTTMLGAGASALIAYFGGPFDQAGIPLLTHTLLYWGTVLTTAGAALATGGVVAKLARR